MALLHAATLTPSKDDLIAAWLDQHAPGHGPAERLGAYRFDDPEGQVGLETFLVRTGGAAGPVWQVPVTYRSAPLDGPVPLLVMQHSALGERWAYDALHDPVYARVLAAVVVSGVGQAVELAVREGHWTASPATVRLHAEAPQGWGEERVVVDGLAPTGDEDGAVVVLAGDGLAVRLWRRPVLAADDATGDARLTGTWPGAEAPWLLAAVSR